MGLLTPEVSPEKRAERVAAYHDGVMRAVGQQMGYAFLAGVELNAAKEQILHGQFEKWRKQFLPHLPERTAQRYMQFATALQTQSPALSDLVQDSPRLLTNGNDFSEAHRKSILEAVHEAADGKALTEMYRDLGVIKQPTHQKDRPRGQRLSPEEADEQRRANAKTFLVTLTGDLETFATDDGALHADLDTPDLKDFQKAVLSASRILRDLLKARTKGAKKKGGRK